MFAWHCARFLPYMFNCTRFSCCTVHILPYMFSEIADRNWNYKGVKLPSGCVVPGSWSVHTFGCCFVNWRGGLMRLTISGFLVLLGWVPCQVGTRLVELASLSSKSTCNLCVAFGVQGTVLASAFLCPVCSISWLGSSREEGSISIGELEKIDLMFVCKVGDICWLKLKQVRCRIWKIEGKCCPNFSQWLPYTFYHTH